MVERFEVSVQAQSCRLVQRHAFAEVGGLRQVAEVIDAGVPRRVPAGPALKLGTEKEDEREVHLRLPLVLVCLLACEVIPGWFRGQRGEPAGRVAECRGEGEPRPTLRGLLRASRGGLGGG